MDVLAVDDLLAPSVDDLALFVHHLVVLERVLADLGVLALDGVLGAFDGLGDHLGFDRQVVGHRAVHDPRDGAGREQSQQVVLQRQVETALAGVALSTGTTAQLVVDATRVVSFRTEHVEPAELADLVAFGLTDGLEARQRALVGGVELLGVRREAATQGVARGESFEVAAEHDVDASTGHVGRDGDGVLASGLGHDLGFAEVLLRVEDLVGDPGACESSRESNSDFSTEAVPSRIGWPRSLRSRTSSTIAANFAASVL